MQFGVWRRLIRPAIIMAARTDYFVWGSAAPLNHFIGMARVLGPALLMDCYSLDPTNTALRKRQTAWTIDWVASWCLLSFIPAHNWSIL